jgi:hypothetical protein
MALNPKFSTGFRDELMNAGDVTNIFDGVNSSLLIYSGAQPSDADQVPGAGTILATVVIPTTNAFAASASGGTIAKAGTWEDTSADATGTAAWFRLSEDDTNTSLSTTVVRIDGTVGTATSDLIIASVSITATDPITIDTFTISIAA